MKKAKATETAAQKAFRLLSEVPKEDFIMGKFTDKKGKCCALGHLVRLQSTSPNNYNTMLFDSEDTEPLNIRDKSNDFIRKHTTILSRHISIASINNSKTYGEYKEKAVKDRVLHLLKDMIAKGY